MGLGNVEDAWTKCLPLGRFVKISSKWEKCILGVYGLGKGFSYERLAWYLADAKSV